MQRVTPSNPLPLWDIAATRLIEQAAATRLSPHTLMKRAGLSAARLALALAPHARTIWIACGPGNNGGDGLEAAMHLRQWGLYPVVTWLGDPTRAPTDALASHQRAVAAGVKFADQPPEGMEPDDLCIDALLGIGVTRPPDGLMAQWIASLNQSAAPVLAMDLPSGLNADTGQRVGGGAAINAGAIVDANMVHASHTLTLLTCKPGLFTASGRDCTGEVWFDDLDVEAGLGQPRAHINVAPRLPARLHASHKGSHGDVAVVGGEGLPYRGMGMTGAALLAARAALYGGAGRILVSLLEDASGAAADALQAELMFRSVDALDLRSLTVVCGCGGGEAIRPVMPAILSRCPRLVLDADALNAVAGDPSLQQLLHQRAARPFASILTPHPLEAARLLQCSTADVMRDRITAAKALAQDTGAVVVLKGSGTVIAEPNGAARLNLTGNARLATGGTGDVLAGLIGARLASGMKAIDAACSAVYLHGAVADEWPAGETLTAGKLAARLRC